MVNFNSASASAENYRKSYPDSVIRVMPAFLLLGHFTFYHPLSPLATAPTILLLYFLARGIFRFTASANILLCFVLMIMYVCLNSIILLYYNDVFIISDFLPSFILFILLVSAIFLSLTVRVVAVSTALSSLRLLGLLGAAHGLLLFIQFLEWNVLGSLFTLNPLGVFSKYGPYGTYYGPVIWDAVFRPNGFFSEPSAAAWFTGLALAGTLLRSRLTGQPARLVVLLQLLGMVSTASLSGAVNAAIILLVWLSLKMPLRINGAYAIAALVAAIFMVYALIYFSGRSEELVTPGTSMYVRLVAPTILVYDVLVNYPLGLALGHQEFVNTREYFIRNDALLNAGVVDNGFHFFIIYFGWIGLAVILYVLHEGFQLFIRKDPVALLFVATALAVSQSGAIWAPNYILIFVYMITVGRALRVAGMKNSGRWTRSPSGGQSREYLFRSF